MANNAWLRQWTGKDGMILRRAVADVAKPSSTGGAGATLADVEHHVQQEGHGQWTLLEIEGEYVVIKTFAPVIRVHIGDPTLG